MTDFTRMTVVGSARRATVVVPSDETVGALLPSMLELLEEPPAAVARPIVLTRLTGEPLDGSRSIAGQAVNDGELLHLLRLDEAPPPPEVSDVTDAVSETFAGRAGLWGPRARVAGAAVGIGVLLLAAGEEALRPPLGAVAVPALAWGVTLLGALGFGLARRPGASAAFLAAALGLVLPTAQLGRAALDTVVRLPQLPGTVLLGSLLAWATVLLGVGLGARHRAAVLGAMIGVAGAVLPLVLLTLGLPVVRTAAVTAVVAVVVCGLIPAYAMNASGLTGLDDQVLTGVLAPRTAVLATLLTAYRALTWSTVAVGGTLTAALLALAVTRNPWALWLGAAVAVVTALRTRAFPLAAQVLSLCAAVVSAVLAAATVLLAHQPVAAAGALVLVAAVIAVLAGARPTRHGRASLRRIGGTVEFLAVLTLVPLALGVFGVYDQLLGAFR